MLRLPSQSVFIRSKSKIELPEQCMKFVQNWLERHVSDFKLANAFWISSVSLATKR